MYSQQTLPLRLSDGDTCTCNDSELLRAIFPDNSLLFWLCRQSVTHLNTDNLQELQALKIIFLIVFSLLKPSISMRKMAAKDFKKEFDYHGSGEKSIIV